jgi:hypothetical protein
MIVGFSESRWSLKKAGDYLFFKDNKNRPERGQRSGL